MPKAQKADRPRARRNLYLWYLELRASRGSRSQWDLKPGRIATSLLTMTGLITPIYYAKRALPQRRCYSTVVLFLTGCKMFSFNSQNSLCPALFVLLRYVVTFVTCISPVNFPRIERCATVDIPSQRCRGSYHTAADIPSGDDAGLAVARSLGFGGYHHLGQHCLRF